VPEPEKMVEKAVAFPNKCSPLEPFGWVPTAPPEQVPLLVALTVVIKQLVKLNTTPAWAGTAPTAIAASGAAVMAKARVLFCKNRFARSSDVI
jgi:hypothetical protein